jgi:arginyl-tRNA synthetase
VITGDLDLVLADAIRAARTTGYLPAAAAPRPDNGTLSTSTRTSTSKAGIPSTGTPSTAGTWRPAPSGAGGGPGTYSTTIAFLLAQRAAHPPRHPAGPASVPPHAMTPQNIASRLAASLRARPEISDVTVTGGGYLTITVTPDTLAALAVRITEAGPGCARGDALRGVTLTAPRRIDLTTARTWDEAYQLLVSEVGGRLAAAAGAHVLWEKKDPAERLHLSDSPSRTKSGPVNDSINFAGADAIRYALCRLHSPGPGHPMGPGRLPGSGRLPGPGRPPDPGRHMGPGRMPGQAAVDARAVAAQHLGNPAYAVRYAHAHAASALRQAADLGLDKGDAAHAQLRLLAHPRERALLDAMSWLPERVGGAARRGRPDVLAAYLEDLAAAYFDCQEGCPAVPPGLPDEPPGSPVTRARLWLAAAARTALGAGLGLLGVAAPDRL